MKKLVLLSLAVGMFSASFADGVKLNRESAPKMAKAIKQSNDVPAAFTSLSAANSGKAKKAGVNNKVSGAENCYLLGNVLDAPYAFGWYAFEGPVIDYSPKIGLISIANVNREAVVIEDSSQITVSYSPDGGQNFANEVVVPSTEILTRLAQSVICVPDGATKYTDAFVVSEGAYFNAESGDSEGQFVAAKKFGAPATTASVSKKANDPSNDTYTFEVRYRATASNSHDNSTWTVMPNFGLDGTKLDYQGNINLLKSVVNAEGAVTTTLQQIDAPVDFFGVLKLSWSCDGKYGVIGWIGTDPAAQGFLVDKQKQYPLYIFTSNYGETWSSVQNGANILGPDGIPYLKEWIPTEILTSANWFNTTEDEFAGTLNWMDFDVTIDRWGNLYFGGGFLFQSGQGADYFSLPIPHGILYSTADSEAANAATNVRNLTSAVMLDQAWVPVIASGALSGVYPFGSNMYTNLYGDPETSSMITGNRFQFIQNKIGTKLGAFWATTANPQDDKSDQYSDLDIFGAGWNLETNRLALVTATEPLKDTDVIVEAPYIFTLETEAEGKNHLLCVAETMRRTDDAWEMPMISTEIYELEDIEINPYYYVGGISFADSDFTINRRNTMPVKDKGVIPEDLADPIGSLVGVNNVETLVPMNLYPNPAVNEINVDVEGEASIYNVAGQLIKTVQVSNGKVDISNLPAGAMIIKAEGKAPQKFIKK